MYKYKVLYLVHAHVEWFGNLVQGVIIICVELYNSVHCTCIFNVKLETYVSLRSELRTTIVNLLKTFKRSRKKENLLKNIVWLEDSTSFDGKKVQNSFGSKRVLTGKQGC